MIKSMNKEMHETILFFLGKTPQQQSIKPDYTVTQHRRYGTTHSKYFKSPSGKLVPNKI